MNRGVMMAMSAFALATSSLPALAADPLMHFTQRAAFDQNTMAGWQRSTGAAAMAYGAVKFHPTKTDAAPARFGVAMTAPYRLNGAGVLLRTEAPKFVDFSFNAKDFSGTWGTSLNLGGARAWTYDPTAPVGEQHTNFLDSGKSWIVVGLATVAIAVGVHSITENGT